MKKLSTYALALSFAALAACSPKTTPETSGPWSLVTKQSDISYVTIKNGSLGEVNTFSMFSGKVTESGKAEFIVYLDSVDTDNDIRDPRMRKILFDTETYPTARASAELNMAQFDELAIGQTKTVLLDLTLELHGIAEQFDFNALVTRVGPNKVRVVNKAPLLIDAEDFGFEAGLAKLQQLAKLESITPVVSATVALTFER